MATTIRYGSSGDDVKRLQQQLNSAGYGLKVDGIFGNDTLNAVKNYQSKNGLSVDGIVGNQTWGKLLGGSGGTPAAAMTAANTANPDQEESAAVLSTTALGTSYDPSKMLGSQADLNAMEGGAPTFQQSQALTDALAQLTGLSAAKPAGYTSPYAAKIEDMYNQVTQRQPFSYDYAADPLYAMYRDRYTQAAQQSMRDTMADAAALTGGYGNSYAAAAAQQAYDNQMNGLNDVLPTLYGQAYTRWKGEGDDLQTRLALLRDMENTEYGRHQDQLADYYDQLSAQRALANDMYSREYGEYADRMAAWQEDRDYYANKAAQEQAAQLAASYGSYSGGGSSGRKSSGSGGTAKAGTSADYKTIAATAAQMTGQKAYDYIGRMVDAGYITVDEGKRILGVEMGLDISQYYTPSASGTSGGTAMTDKKNYESSGAAAYGAAKALNENNISISSGTNKTTQAALEQLLKKKK